MGTCLENFLRVFRIVVTVIGGTALTFMMFLTVADVRPGWRSPDNRDVRDSRSVSPS